MKYYYMINGKIMSANEKMPELRIVQHKDYNQKFEDSKFKMFYNNWLNSLQPCEISESELEKVKGVVYHLTSITISILSINNPIEVTDLIADYGCDHNGVWRQKLMFKQPSDKNGVITFKEKVQTMIKDKYREEKNNDVYSDNSSGSYSDEYVKWLEYKIDELKEPKQVEEIEAVKLQFFKEFGSQSFRGYPLEQCHSIWDFFKPHLKRNI